MVCLNTQKKYKKCEKCVTAVEPRVTLFFCFGQQFFALKVCSEKKKCVPKSVPKGAKVGGA